MGVKRKLVYKFSNSRLKPNLQEKKPLPRTLRASRGERHVQLDTE